MSNLCLLNTRGIHAATANPQRIQNVQGWTGYKSGTMFLCNKNSLLKSVHGSTLFNRSALYFCLRFVSGITIFKKISSQYRHGSAAGRSIRSTKEQIVLSCMTWQKIKSSVMVNESKSLCMVGLFAYYICRREAFGYFLLQVIINYFLRVLSGRCGFIVSFTV